MLLSPIQARGRRIGRQPGVLAGGATLQYNDSMNATIASQETEILARVIGPDNPSFTPAVARSILQLRFSETDTERMNQLAEKARQGILTDEEQSQLHGYLFVGAMIDLMHSKARLSLKDASQDR